MIQGIHVAVAGMTSQMQRQDQIANNLANSNTTGFKQSGLFTEAFQKYLADDQLRPNVNSQLKVDQVYVDFTEGPMKKTGNPLDLMVKGNGFFTVMTENGIRYTRNGHFSLDEDGYLVTSDGNKVMGRGEYLRLDHSSQIRINKKGELIQDDMVKGVLHMVDFKKPYRLMRTGNNMYLPDSGNEVPQVALGYEIIQGHLEGSNVNTIKNMVEMISAHRNFEAGQRALTSIDETAQKAVREVGRVSG